MSKFILFLCLTIFLGSCFDPFDFTSEGNWKTYIIKKGNSSPSVFKIGYRQLNRRELKFLAIFDEGIPYRHLMTTNQSQWNKLYGVSCKVHPHKHSARFAWRELKTDPNKVEIAAYWWNVDVDNDWNAHIMDTVNMNDIRFYEINADKQKFSWYMGTGKYFEIASGDNCDWFGRRRRMFPYFGGSNNDAPLDIVIRIQELK